MIGAIAIDAFTHYERAFIDVYVNGFLCINYIQSDITCKLHMSAGRVRQTIFKLNKNAENKPVNVYR